MVKRDEPLSWDEIREFFSSFGPDFFWKLVDPCWNYKVTDRPDLAWFIKRGPDGRPVVEAGWEEEPEAVLIYNEAALRYIMKRVKRDSEGRPDARHFYKLFVKLMQSDDPKLHVDWEVKLGVRIMRRRGYEDFAREMGLIPKNPYWGIRPQIVREMEEKEKEKRRKARKSGQARKSSRAS